MSLALNLVFAKKKKIWETYKWEKSNKSTLKIELIFTTTGLISKNFDAKLLKIDKKDYNEIDIYYIGYVTIKKIGDYNNINSVNPLYLMINEMIGHFEEKNENKYLVLDDVDENKEVSKNMKKFGKVLKKKLKRLMVAKKLNMEKIT